MSHVTLHRVGAYWHNFVDDAAGLTPQRRMEASLHWAEGTTAPTVTDVLDLERSERKRALFSEEVLNEAKVLTPRNPQLPRRRVQGVRLSIDEYQTVDLDNALSFRREADGTFVIGLSVADVSAWIRMGSALDHAARLRCESQYRGDIVAPMFPRPLSEDLFSLHGGEERLAKTVEMRFSADGKLVGHEIFRSVFVNNHRLDAGDAQLCLDGTKGKPDLQDALKTMVLLSAHHAGGPEGQRHSLKRMMEYFTILSANLVARDLAAAGIATSFRNQTQRNAKSSYGPQALGHISMGLDAYVQWTAPIRRYADIDVHRAIERLIDGQRLTGRKAEIDERLRAGQHARTAAGGDPSVRLLDVLIQHTRRAGPTGA